MHKFSSARLYVNKNGELCALCNGYSLNGTPLFESKKGSEEELKAWLRSNGATWYFAGYSNIKANL